ncbi:hypothetical protein VNO78_14227 [Psophocarpus tetragonolobus]|uniref:C2H2-type domain-containing protein n=1 Tax=Psophocarpus tetragonolobus TaxID=3891 RepID=A0AAN9XPY8_PSOTE
MKRGRKDHCLMLLSKVGASESDDNNISGDFKCKTCNRRFSSYQALGGHRASHKKPKLMVTDVWWLSPTMKEHRNRMHPCPICGLQFGVGQALGGHMRKHTSRNLLLSRKLSFSFDLNLTPLENHHLNLNLRTPLLI